MKKYRTKEHRVKQVSFPFSSGIEEAFYPQIKYKIINTKGILWWKEKQTEEVWDYLYEWNSGMLAISPSEYSKLVACSTMEEAKNKLDLFEKQVNELVAAFNQDLKTKINFVEGTDCIIHTL